MPSITRICISWIFDQPFSKPVDIYKSVELSQISSLSAASIVCTKFVLNMREIYVQYVSKTTTFCIQCLRMRRHILHSNSALYAPKICPICTQNLVQNASILNAYCREERPQGVGAGAGVPQRESTDIKQRQQYPILLSQRLVEHSTVVPPVNLGRS